MKAAAVAFVLVLGAAVVLAFANTLNSWVLGGLIGGLAALLLSIPISLALFTVLARRHDERRAGDEQEEFAFDDYYQEEQFAEVYEADAYVLPEEDDFYEEPRPRRAADMRNAPAPSYARLPAAGQSHAPANGSYSQRSANNPQASRQSSQSLPAARARSSAAPVQGLTPERGLPAARSQSSTTLARHRTAALRAARREAVQGQDDVEVVPTSTAPLRRPPVGRGAVGPRPTRQLSPQPSSPSRARRVDEGTAQQTGARRGQHRDDEYSAKLYAQTDALRSKETETDRLRGRYPQTGPVRQPQQQPETGKMTRNPQPGEQPRKPEVITGSLRNPLVRRPPYMYEDDPLREELAQYIEPPIVRRSSRQQAWEDDEEN